MMRLLIYMHVLILPLVLTSPAVGQNRGKELGDRVGDIVSWNQSIIEYRSQQREALRLEYEARRKKLASEPLTNLPQESPIELLEPWVFESTLERRAKEKRDPYVFVEQREKIKSTGPDIVKIPWFKRVSQDHAANAEWQQKQSWLDELAFDLPDKLKRLKSLSGVQKTILEKEIRHQVALAERIACTLASCAWPDPVKGKDKTAEPVQPKLPDKIELPPIRQTSGSADKALPKSEKPKLKMMTGFASGLLYQIGLHHERLAFEAHDKDAYRKTRAAEKDYGDGLSGGGGVTLHTPATIDGPLDPAGVERAAVTDGRLLLVMRDGSHVRMPKMPLDDLAVAIWAIYGPNNLLEGTLEAVDGKAIIYKTGPDLFGDVVWRKSYLPLPWKSQEIGQRIGLPIAPAVGIMALPEPSVSRVTFYGDIKNTRIGQVISEADHLLNFFMSGVDPETGKLARLPEVPDFMSSVEILARDSAGLIKLPPWKPAPKSDANDPYAKSWWRGGTFFVWVPNSVRFKYVPQSKQVVPVEIGMKLETWTANVRGAQPVERALADFISNNFRQLANHYPVLNDLNDVLATVSIVRWLKVNNIAVDLKWARERKIMPVGTPERSNNFWTTPVNGEDGKPIFRKAEAAQ